MMETAGSGNTQSKSSRDATYRDTTRSENILEKLHNLKDRICDFENLMAAYRMASKGKRYRNEVLSFSMNLGENLLALQKELLTETYKVGHYREFYVQYPKPRLVMALGFKDRIVQWAVYRQVNPYLDTHYIDQSYGCRVDKGTLKAAEKLFYWMQEISRKPDAEEWFIVYGDVTKFFYRVSHDLAMAMYEELSDDQWFIWMMDTIINNHETPFGLPLGVKPENCPKEMRLYDIGMPIGNLTSQGTANFYLDKLDQYVKHTLHVHRYDRYMDDFALIVHGRDHAHEVFDQVSRFLTDNLRLTVSPKCRIQRATEPIEFCGYVCTQHGIRVRKKTTRHVKRSTRHLVKQTLKGEVKREKAEESITSYKGLFVHVNGYDLLRWISDHTKELKKVKTGAGTQFYTIKRHRKDGLADVFLFPSGFPTDVSDPRDAKDVKILAVFGVVWTETLATDIRMRYYDWCEMAEVIADGEGAKSKTPKGER